MVAKADWLGSWNQSDRHHHPTTPVSTDRLFFPDILLYDPLNPFILGAQLLTCPYRCDGFGERAWLVWVCDEASLDGIGAFALAGFGELFRVTICSPSVPLKGWDTYSLPAVLPAASCLRAARCARPEGILLVGRIGGRVTQASCTSISSLWCRSTECASGCRIPSRRIAAVSSTARSRCASASAWSLLRATATSSSSTLTSHRHGCRCGGCT